MLAKKIFSRSAALLILALALVVAGCTPPGPRALLRGKTFLERGDPAAAVEELKTATALLPANAQAWNYLGVACQRAGQPAEAAIAYQRALVLDRDLMEARYNLGSLWLEQNRLAEAKTEFTAYTLRRSNAPEGWLQLGAAQLRAGDFIAAEKSFGTVLALSANNAEALNGLGLARLQRGRPREASQFFASAVQYHPDYAPARLNLATVAQQDLHDVRLALQHYQAYLALDPRPGNWEAVNTLARNLEGKSSPAAAASPAASPALRASVPVPSPVAAEIKISSVARPVVSLKPVILRESPSPAPRLVPPAPAAKVKTEPVAVAPVAPPRAAVAPPALVAPATSSLPEHYVKTGVTPLPPAGSAPAGAPLLPPKFNLPAPAPTIAASVEKPAPAAPVLPRYLYVSPAKPAPGDRVAAGYAFSKARLFEQGSHWTEALEWYRRAAAADPSWFEAQYNQGVLAYRLRNFTAALSVYEKALALQPGSADARYNFALTLKSAGYATDAVNELEKIAAANPTEVRAHLALGNLYARQFRNLAPARKHYLKVLELDPHNPQAADIRYWLAANPA